MEPKKVTFLIPLGRQKKSVYSLNKNLPVGVANCATILSKEGHEVEVLDESLKRFDPDKVDTDIVALSALTASANEAYKLADKFRARGIKTIMGGIHASLVPEEAAGHVDQVIIGEGEGVISDVINGRREDTIICAPPVLDMDAIPFADYSLIRGISERPGMVFMSSSRGCPYDCKFCSVVKMFGRKYRFRSTENILAEIKQRRPKRIFFSDDNFTAMTKRAMGVCSGMIEQGTSPKWWGSQARVELARKPELLAKMSESGCNLLYIGLESINPKTLAQFNKKQTTEDVHHAVKTLHDYGIEVFGMFVLGSDYDTKQTVLETTEFAQQMDIDYIQFAASTPLPGTELRKEMLEQDRIFNNNWDYYDLNHVVFRPRLIDPYELQVEILGAFKKFYSMARAVTLFMYGQFHRWVINGFARHYVRVWEKQNEEYLEYLDKVTTGKVNNSIAPDGC